MLKPITIRLPHAMVERIEAIVVERALEGVDKASVVRELIAESLKRRDEQKAA